MSFWLVQTADGEELGRHTETGGLPQVGEHIDHDGRSWRIVEVDRSTASEEISGTLVVESVPF